MDVKIPLYQPYKTLQAPAMQYRLCIMLLLSGSMQTSKGDSLPLQLRSLLSKCAAAAQFDVPILKRVTDRLSTSCVAVLRSSSAHPPLSQSHSIICMSSLPLIRMSPASVSNETVFTQPLCPSSFCCSSMRCTHAGLEDSRRLQWRSLKTYCSLSLTS